MVKAIVGAEVLDAKKIARREAIRKGLFWACWGVFIGFAGVLGASVVRFIYPRIVFEPSSIFKAGKPDDYKAGSVTLVTGRRVFIVRMDKGVYALSAKCTHLGCQPIWYEDQQIFKCPCHGARFTKEGINFAGPAPLPLPRFYLSMSPDGHIQVDKSRVVSMDFLLEA
ncbi:MAG TPA: ubiquinol-cytochrome c reductase iron-sulfur subunit [Candidatus Hypogeohydataceae bacterium YC41]